MVDTPALFDSEIHFPRLEQLVWRKLGGLASCKISTVQIATELLITPEQSTQLYEAYNAYANRAYEFLIELRLADKPAHQRLLVRRAVPAAAGS